MNEQPSERSDDVAIDPDHPWLGLSSYSEETRAYFHGRDEEAAELARRVQRKLLTVLFGQSGLGKTSLLRAGLVPRLRGENFCPVYVRIDYSAESPSPSEQIKQAIFRATAAAGFWTRAGSAIEGESLWEFLHHRGDLLRDASGRMLLPLLIFDQFEEIFTLAQADDAGRQRARRFLEDLADLVENRPPADLERRLDLDENAAEAFDFARADYRILIALREDYLAHLESVKGIMPSITQNRMRLARMNGAQALSAVLEPGGRLVSEEIAQAIVRFVAGGSELANAEVEPSLLSLVCRELNNVRIAQGRSEISADLLAGSRDTILSEFYERTLADQPAGVRRVIEDELLTESGYRESLAEERVAKALAAAGAAPEALATLVDRRLLRIEERLDMRRVELTHDVLCSVVGSSRDLRHSREARDEAERQLALQQEREAQTHRTLVRTRMVAGVSAVLMLIAVASAVFGWINLKRARVADAQAQQARGDAEKLVGFLIEDFYTELQPTGRLETMGRLARMAVDYYDGLPPELLTPKTQTYRAMALVREGAALNASGDLKGADRNFADAQATFTKLREAGDESEAVTLGLALAHFHQGSTVMTGRASTDDQLQAAAGLLRPLVQSGTGSRQVKLAYADVLNYLSHAVAEGEEAFELCEEARGILAELGAKDLRDLEAASIYADTSDSQARHAMGLGRLDVAASLEKEVYDIAEKVLARRPGDLRAMQNRALAADLLGSLAERGHDYTTAMAFAARAAQAGDDYVRFNPSDLNAWLYVVRGRGQLADFKFSRGQVGEAIEIARGTVALHDDKRLAGNLDPTLLFTWLRLASLEAKAGQRAAAERSFEGAIRANAASIGENPDAAQRRKIQQEAEAVWRSRVQLHLRDDRAALLGATAAASRLDEIKVPDEQLVDQRLLANVLRGALITAGIAAIRQGEPAQAEYFAGRRLKLAADPFTETDPDNEYSRARAQLAHAMALQGRGEEAVVTLQPALDFYRREQQRGAKSVDFNGDFAYALYASALAQPATAGGQAARSKALAEAAALLAALSAEARQLSDLRLLGEWIAAARAG